MTSMTSPPQTDGGRAGGGGYAGQGRQFSPQGQQFGQQFGGQQFAGQGQQQGTGPISAGFARGAEQAPAVQSAGLASRYWYEAIPIPAGPAKLHLFVNDTRWVFLQSPSTTILNLVQEAFLGADSRVQVWYDDQNNTIVGLVIEGS